MRAVTLQQTVAERANGTKTADIEMMGAEQGLVANTVQAMLAAANGLAASIEHCIAFHVRHGTLCMFHFFLDSSPSRLWAPSASSKLAVALFGCGIIANEFILASLLCWCSC